MPARISDVVFGPDDALRRVEAIGDAFSGVLDDRARLPDPGELEAAVAQTTRRRISRSAR